MDTNRYQKNQTAQTNMVIGKVSGICTIVAYQYLPTHSYHIHQQKKCLSNFTYSFLPLPSCHHWKPLSFLTWSSVKTPHHGWQSSYHLPVGKEEKTRLSMVAGGSGAGSGSAKVRKGFGSYEIMAGLGVSYEGCGLVNVGFEYINKWKCWGEQWYRRWSNGTLWPKDTYKYSTNQVHIGINPKKILEIRPKTKIEDNKNNYRSGNSLFPISCPNKASMIDFFTSSRHLIPYNLRFQGC